jgi:hypothetical protein
MFPWSQVDAALPVSLTRRDCSPVCRFTATTRRLPCSLPRRRCFLFHCHAVALPRFKSVNYYATRM